MRNGKYVKLEDVVKYLEENTLLAKCCKYAYEYKKASVKKAYTGENIFGEPKTKDQVRSLYVQALKDIVSYFHKDSYDVSIEIGYDFVVRPEDVDNVVHNPFRYYTNGDADDIQIDGIDINTTDTNIDKEFIYTHIFPNKKHTSIFPIHQNI